jgi:hypothetical protein
LVIDWCISLKGDFPRIQDSDWADPEKSTQICNTAGPIIELFYGWKLRRWNISDVILFIQNIKLPRPIQIKSQGPPPFPTMNEQGSSIKWKSSPLSGMKNDTRSYVNLKRGKCNVWKGNAREKTVTFPRGIFIHLLKVRHDPQETSLVFPFRSRHLS